MNARRHHTATLLVVAASLTSCSGPAGEAPATGAPAVKRVEEVAYGTHERHRLDLYRPPRRFKGPRPVLIHVHGGGWVMGSKDKVARGSRKLALEGLVVVAPNYRLVRGPQTRWPACWEDMQAVLRWVQDNADRYQMDPSRVAAMGYSAGGHLASLLGTRAETRGKIRCVVDFFGPIDMRPEQSGRRGPNLLIGSGVTRDRKLFLDASPIHHVSAQTPPFLILHGDKDRMVPLTQSQRFLKVLRAHKVDAHLQVYPGIRHGFQRFNDDKSKAATRDAYRRALAFLKKHLGM